MPFDAREAKLLQAGQHVILPEHPGLRLQATASRRAWIYRYKSPVDGGMRQLKLGEWPAMSYPDAVTAWNDRRKAREAGKDPALEKRAARREERAAATGKKDGPYLVADLIRDYLEGHVDVRRAPKGRKEVRRVLTAHTGAIADQPAALLRRSDAFGLIEQLKATPVIAAQVRQELGAAWDHALDAGRLPDSAPNWWRQIMRGKLRSKGKKISGEHIGTAKRVLTDQEVGLLLAWLPNFSKLIADVLTVYLWTGTRGAEIVGMEKTEIAREATGWWWTIPKERTKNQHRDNATDLRVPLIGRALQVVQRRMDVTDRYLFHTLDRTGPIAQKVIQSGVYYFQPYSRTKNRGATDRPRLPVTHWAPHDLRRTVRTMLASMGCPGEVAESVLGHMLPGVVGVYNRHSYDAERLEWLTRLDARLEDLARQHVAATAAARAA